MRVQERPGGEGEPQQGAAGGGAVSALRSPAGLRRDAQGGADVKKKKKCFAEQRFGPRLSNEIDFIFIFINLQHMFSHPPQNNTN